MTNNRQFAHSLESLSHSSARSENVFRLEDLTWEHFLINEELQNVDVAFYERLHIDAASNHLDGLDGKSVLELGAYEGFHSIELEKLGAAEITAIEGNPRNFLKCCAVKNHYRLNNTQYCLGDCEVYLNECDKKFDLVVASGILYHLFDPIAALEDICRLTDNIAICTTYYHPQFQRFKYTGNTKLVGLPGMEGRVVYERYNTQVVKDRKHGMNDRAWMFDFDTLLVYLSSKGFEYTVLNKVEREEPFKVRAQVFAHR